MTSSQVNVKEAERDPGWRSASLIVMRAIAVAAMTSPGARAIHHAVIK
ncbi:hypothetical protein ACVWY3_004789 [Bradyrhizobium sp. USDA 4486]